MNKNYLIKISYGKFIKDLSTETHKYYDHQIVFNCTNN